MTDPEKESGPGEPDGLGVGPKEDRDAGKRTREKLRELGKMAVSALKKAVMTPQILFLIVAVVFGLLMVFVTPMFHVPDEPAHFYKAFAVAEGHLLSTNKAQGEGSDLPTSVVRTMNLLNPLKDRGLKSPEWKVEQAFHIPLKSGEQMFVVNNGMRRYSPLQYVPQAIGIDIGRIFDLSPLAIAYMGRVFNLLAWLIIVFLAISITPVLRWTFFLLGIMPMAVHMAGSLSGDTMTIALAFLFIAFVLKLALAKDKDRVNRRDLVVLFVLAALLALVKAPYYLLILMFLMIPVSKFKGRKAYYATFALLIVLVLVIGVSWSLMQTAAWSPASRIIGAPGQSSQVSYIIHHPFTYGVTLLRTINVQKDFFLSSFVGAFGWFETGVPIWFTYLFLFALISVSALEENEIIVRTRQKVVNIVSIILIFLAILTTFYLYWTNVGAIIIQGVQGRYLIPLAPPFFLLFYNRTIKYEKGKWFYVSMVAIGVVAILISISTIWARFY